MNKKIINYFFVVGSFSLLLLFSIDTIHAENSESQANVSFYGEYVFPEGEVQEMNFDLNAHRVSIPMNQKYLPQTGVKYNDSFRWASVFIIVAGLIQMENVRYFKGRDFSHET